MANLNFKYGQVNNLPRQLSAGCVYVTTDERSMYVDLPIGGNTQRIRLGDFLEYNTLEELNADKKNWSTSTLVYIKTGNILAKYNEIRGSDGNIVTDESGNPTYEWKRINDSDTLVSNIANLTSRITTAETAINTNANNIAAEATTARAAEKKLTDDLATEAATARAAEKKLTDDLATEAATARAAEKKLTDDLTAANSAITTNAGNIAKNTAAIAKETADRQTAIQNLSTEINNKMQTADAMTFKGVVDDTHGLPIVNKGWPVQAGDTYKVGFKKSYIPGDSTVQYVGDLLIAKEDQPDDAPEYTGGWYHISSGYEDDYAPYLELLKNQKIDTTTNITADIITLVGGAGEKRGGIYFESENENLKVLTSTYSDTSAGGDGIKVSFNLAWGTF